MGSHPLEIPNSWFLVLFSEDLPRGSVKPLQHFGRQLVAFRGEDGEARVLDAYCPHLGAHLGHGGRVVGDTIRCPFHGWRWAGDGSCAEVPYARRVPPGARIGTWPVQEVNGQIWVWHHAEGADPSFWIPRIPEFGSEEWTSRWTRYEWEIHTHPQELMENAIDWPHFEFVHHTDVPTFKESSFEGPMFRWVVDAGYEKSLVGGPSKRLYLVAENWGLGFNMIHYNGAFETLSVGAITPIDHERVFFSNCVIGRKGRRSEEEALAELKAQMDEQQHTVEQDFAIWENKKYQPRPVLCQEDGPIAEYRRWASQFYSRPLPVGDEA